MTALADHLDVPVGRPQRHGVVPPRRSGFPSSATSRRTWMAIEDEQGLAEGVADRVLRRPRRRARRLLRVPRRLAVGLDRARRRRRAARVPERVPPPRQRDLPGHRFGPRRAALPVPPLGLGPERPAPRGAVAQVVRHARQRRLRAVPGPGRHVGADRVRQPRPRCDAARRLARGRPRRRGVGRPRRVPLQQPDRRARCPPTGRWSPRASRRRITSRASTPRCSATSTTSTRRSGCGTATASATSSTACRRPGSAATCRDQRRLGHVDAVDGHAPGRRPGTGAPCPDVPRARRSAT